MSKCCEKIEKAVCCPKSQVVTDNICETDPRLWNLSPTTGAEILFVTNNPMSDISGYVRNNGPDAVVVQFLNQLGAEIPGISETVEPNSTFAFDVENVFGIAVVLAEGSASAQGEACFNQQYRM